MIGFYVVTPRGPRHYTIDDLNGFRLPMVFESETQANDMCAVLNAAHHAGPEWWRRT